MSACGPTAISSGFLKFLLLLFQTKFLEQFKQNRGGGTGISHMQFLFSFQGFLFFLSAWSRMFYSHHIRYSLLELLSPPVFLTTIAYAFTFTSLTTFVSFPNSYSICHFLDMETSRGSVLNFLLSLLFMVIIYSQNIINSLCVWVLKLYL